MTSSLRLTLLVAAGSLLTACPPTCGGFDGGGDQVFAKPNGDRAIACASGGFVATRAGVSMEGRISGISVVDGPTGALAFVFVESEWTVVEMNEVTLDRADAMCQELTARTWWTAASTLHLPVATAFTKPAEGFTSVEACHATHPDGVCEDAMLLCPDGTARISTDGSDDVGTYSSQAGELEILTSTWGISGTYTGHAVETISYAHGNHELVRWQTTPLAKISLACK